MTDMTYPAVIENAYADRAGNRWVAWLSADERVGPTVESAERAQVILDNALATFPKKEKS